jgi:hypothetical protein
MRVSYGSVQLPLCLTKHYAMKVFVGVNVQIYVFLTSAPAGSEWLALCTGSFTPGETAPLNHWIGGLVGPRTGLDDTEKWQFLTLPALELRPLGRPDRSQWLHQL